MGALLRPSEPPPAIVRAKPLHRAYLTPLPAMRIKTPHREKGRRMAAERIDYVLSRRAVENTELAEALEVNPKLVEGWRDAKEGLQLGDCYAMALVGASRQAIAILQDAINRIQSLSHNED